MSTSSTRRLRAFKRWMTSANIQISDALDLIDAGKDDGGGISIHSKCKLFEGDLVATIPKEACLTIRTSGARDVIEEAGLEGGLGLSVAIMYERSLGPESPWAGYLEVLPEKECLPLVWSLDEIDELLVGTEIYQTVKEDKGLLYQDWKECILPLIDSFPSKIDLRFFGVEDYFAAKSLVASRSFQIDDYHGIGMVPLADLFNHKTGAEDVHFTAASDGESDDDVDQAQNDENVGTNGAQQGENSQTMEVGSFDNSQQDIEDPKTLEMIIVKDVNAGVEVFNTYGIMGNAALLHRYGFTEADNRFDIVNIDLDLVIQWSSSTFSGRHTRARVAMWRKLGYSGCVSGNSEYFEVSFDGEPQTELLILLYIILLSDEAYSELNLALAVSGNSGDYLTDVSVVQGKPTLPLSKLTEMSNDVLLTASVRLALSALADMRERLYGTASLDNEIKTLESTCCIRERKLYHSLRLQVCERTILNKLRGYAGKASSSVEIKKGAGSKVKLKRCVLS